MLGQLGVGEGLGAAELGIDALEAERVDDVGKQFGELGQRGLASEALRLVSERAPLAETLQAALAAVGFLA